MKFEPVDPAPTETGCPLVLFRRAPGVSSWDREIPLLRSTAAEGAEQNDLHRE
jgi:hypothetical protein